MTVAVQLTDVTKSFGDVTAVDRVSLQLEAGSFTTLVGPSGCGKTTLLRMVAGLESPTSGTIEIFGTPVYSSAEKINVPPHRRQLGMVFQSYALWPHLTAFDNVAYPLRRMKEGRFKRRVHDRAEITEKVHDALAAVDCVKLAERYPSEMSGGQQQRVALARAIVASPSLVLMDEPLSNLDAKLRARLRFELCRIQQDLGFTALYVTHDRSEAISMSDVVVVLRDGHIEQQGGPPEVYEHPATSYVSDFLGDHNLLHAHPSVADDGTVRVATAFGPADVPSEMIDKVPAGECLSAAVPRGAIKVRKSASADAAASVVGVAFCGWYSEVLLTSAGGEEATARLDGRTSLAPGDVVDTWIEKLVALSPAPSDKEEAACGSASPVASTAGTLQ